ncbi:MAG TPA: condensation domain-containing protein [Kineosporiaceae bacterium]|nr:condensation domain-containing protein [Kineosporiaceae bacterium]
MKIGGYRIELGEIEAALSAHPRIGAAVVVAHGDPRGSRRLVAYIAQDGAGESGELSVEEVRAWTRSRLPEYMTPQTIITLDALPLTANGKLDRRNLPDPAQHSATLADSTPPRTPTEHALTEIWAALLGSTPGVHANLFDLGADSLLALRATAAADTHGIHLELRHVLQHPTIAEQAGLAGIGSAWTDADEPVGPCGLTPSQIWFLEQDIPGRDRWNDASFLLTLQRPLKTDHFVASVRSIVEHHDALRLRFSTVAGKWQAEVAPFDPATDLPFSVHDLSDLTGRAQRDAVTAVCDQLQGSLDLGQGPLLRVAYFDLGERPHCLLFLAHWLAVDHYSGRVLLEDLLTTYSVLEAGERPTLPGRTASFRSWTRRLAEYAGSDEVRGQLGIWTDPARATVDRIRQDHDSGPNDLASLQTLTVRIDHDVTQALIAEVPALLGVDVAELLCSAVLLSVPLADSAPRPRRLLVDLERHGRDVPVPGSGVGRTVGRFSTITPVLVDWDPRSDCVDVLSEVAARLREEPNLGAGYGLLRYLTGDPEAAAELAGRPGAEIGVNYLGRVDEVFLRSDLLSVPRMTFGRQRTTDGRRPRLLDVVAYVIAGQLTISVSYSSHRFQEATVQGLADGIGARLGGLAAAAQRAESSTSAAKV